MDAATRSAAFLRRYIIACGSESAAASFGTCIENVRCVRVLLTASGQQVNSHVSRALLLLLPSFWLTAALAHDPGRPALALPCNAAARGLFRRSRRTSLQTDAAGWCTARGALPSRASSDQAPDSATHENSAGACSCLVARRRAAHPCCAQRAAVSLLQTRYPAVWRLAARCVWGGAVLPSRCCCCLLWLRREASAHPAAAGRSWRGSRAWATCCGPRTATARCTFATALRRSRA